MCISDKHNPNTYNQLFLNWIPNKLIIDMYIIKFKNQAKINSYYSIHYLGSCINSANKIKYPNFFVYAISVYYNIEICSKL